jgi:GDPmannose 4,6-dehydratase
MKKALITGVTGQDGAYLSKLLLSKGYKVFGTFRRVSTPNFWRLQNLGIFNKVNLIPADLLDMGSLLEALKVSEPDEVYNLAAASYVATSFEEAIGNSEVTGLAVTRFLEAIRHQNSDIKFYQASSSEMYGNNNFSLQNEKTPFLPSSPYAAAKLYAHSIANIYRQSYNIFTCSGILFNHESPLRGMEFVSRKITNSVAEISLGLKDKLILGNLKAERDWGFAGEYMEAIHLMMQQDKPDDYVIATGISHSVTDFVKTAFDIVGLNWKKYVKTDKKFFRPFEVKHLKGNSKKAAKQLKWKPKISFKKLVKIMLDEDIRRWNDFLNGKAFPWDAPLYPNESTLITRLSKSKTR